jgi:hypothetical protein
MSVKSGDPWRIRRRRKRKTSAWSMTTGPLGKTEVLKSFIFNRYIIIYKERVLVQRPYF